MPRTWSWIEIKINYGFFAHLGSSTLTCYSDGELCFEGFGRFISNNENIYDREHSISKASLLKLDKLVDEVLRLQPVIESEMLDGPSFECTVHFENGLIKGFGYVSATLSPEHGGNLEKDMRKILREEFFLKKHEEDLSGFG